MLQKYNPSSGIINNIAVFKILRHNEEHVWVRIGGDITDITSAIPAFYNWYEYFTTEKTPLDNGVSIDILYQQHKEQLELVTQYTKQFWYTNKEKNVTIDQYRNVFFYNGYGYSTTILFQPDNFPVDEHTHNEHIKEDSVLEFKAREILKAAKFSFNVFVHWGNHHLKWQEDMVFDENRFIVVLWSRQIGKSKSMAARALLSTFKWVNRDIGVLAYLTETTEHIKKYLIQMVDNIEEAYWEGIFEVNKQKWFVINKVTNSRIVFRSLSKWWDRVRWHTFHEVIMDECLKIDNWVFEQVVYPTVTTTWGTICMISTPWSSGNWFFDECQKAKQGRKWYSYYEIDVTKNPFIDPVMREDILSRKDNPYILQEYFCQFVTEGNSVFRPQIITNHSFVQNATQSHFVFAYDPARKGADKAAFACLQVFNWHVYLIRSWYIPDHFKETYDSQFQFLQTVWKEYPFKKVIDCTGLGDGVVVMLKKMTAVDMAIQYVWGNAESEDTNYPYWNTKTMRVGKSRLINNAQDFFDWHLCSTYKYTNEDFINETKAIVETRTQNSINIWFTTAGYDDATNAVMIGLYYIQHHNLLGRAVLLQHSNQFMDAMQKDFNVYSQSNQKRSQSIW